MIKVLVLIPQMNRTGKATIAMNYLRFSDSDRVTFDFLVNHMGQGDYEREIEELGGRVYHMGPIKKFRMGAYKKELRAFLKKHPDYDVIHSHLEDKSLFALKIAAEMKIPVRICHAHSHPTYINQRSFERYCLKHLVRKYTTHRIACSRDVAKWMFGSKGAMDCLILKNAIDTEKFKYDETVRMLARKELKIKDELVIGHIGSFKRIKNHRKLLHIFAEVKRRNSNSKLVIIGGGDSKKEVAYRERFMQRVRTMQLQDSVIFTGVRSDVERIMQAFDVFLLPSYSEGFPVTLVEAQSMGIRCVVSDEISPVCDIVGNTEFLPLVLRASMWANRILKISKEDKKDYGCKVKNAGYDIRDNVGVLMDYYESLCKGSNSDAERE